jgi:hypothetical protein
MENGWMGNGNMADPMALLQSKRKMSRITVRMVALLLNRYN